ncbi:hypothetical protein C8F04DRAFT_1238582 [Mycena alexandri]|uniref:NACHT domain-containing protein n=1 Tax=Mycena alexandri TaxID=1745969 RepID=A0AAD6WVB7_9AGAR|nr:hypothetical protein C8F04DRAFT_1238582 [Mycena alexandri]
MTRFKPDELLVDAKEIYHSLPLALGRVGQSASRSETSSRLTETDTPSTFYPTYYPFSGSYGSVDAHSVRTEGVPAIPQQWVLVSFPSPSSTNIYCSAFLAAHCVKRARPRSEIGLDILRRSCFFPLHDLTSACHPETRKETLKILYEWALDASSASAAILWLQGPAGVGKSTILRTLAQQIGQLGASFVFNPQYSAERNANAFFCVLAYQLAINIPSLRASISSAVRKNPSIIEDTMEVQLQELILKPCRRVILLRSLILVIDGIDEFASDVQREILRLLGNTFQSQSSPLRIIIASRQMDHHLTGIVAQPFLDGLWRSFHVGPSFADVRSYLCTELARIRELGPNDTAPSQWFSPHVLDFLVNASSGCFLYASTLIKFLGDADFSTKKRLAAVMSFPLDHLNSSLDKLYVQILMTVPMASRQSLLVLLHILTTEAFVDLPLHHLEQLLRMKPARLRRILRRLRAVLNAPTSDSGQITAHHPSFLDFLVDPVRSGPFCVCGVQHSALLVRRILKALAYVHQDPHLNRAGHIAWTHLTAMVDFVTSVYPSPEFVPLVQRINPDFFFGSLTTFDQLGNKILVWLNKMYPRPAEVINAWEDYAYMAFFHSTVTDFDFDEEESDILDVSELGVQQQILLRQPELIRLLRFSMVLPALTPLFQFRTLLGASWDDLRQIVVFALRPVFGRNSAALTQLWTSLQNPDFAPTTYPWPSIFRDLAYQSIRIAKGVPSSMPKELMGYWLEWGRYVRSSPPSPEILQELSTLVPRHDGECGLSIGNEVYDVLKWFESNPHVSHEEESRWAKYLPAGTGFELDYAYGARWMSWRGLEWYEV